MLKVFNAFQMTALFAAAPYGIQWLSGAQFPGHTAAFWAGVIGYGIFVVLMTAAVTIALEKE